MDGNITISRVYCNMEDDYIEIRIRDDLSCEEFVTAKLSLATFATAITGLARAECKIELHGLDRVGKKHEWRSLEFPMPKCDYKDRKSVAIVASQDYIPEGWTSDNYYGSQESFFRKDGVDMARVTIRRWV